MCVMCCETTGHAAIYGDGANSGWLEMASGRRSIGTAAVALVLVGVGAFVWWQPARQQPPRFGRGAAGDGPVPVIAALTKRADVPVYLDGVGTIKALNTVTVLPQVDGRLLSVNYTEGQEVAPRLRAGEDRSCDLSGRLRSGRGEEGAGRSDARQCDGSIWSATPSSRPAIRWRASNSTPRRRPSRSSKPR